MTDNRPLPPPRKHFPEHQTKQTVNLTVPLQQDSPQSFFQAPQNGGSSYSSATLQASGSGASKPLNLFETPIPHGTSSQMGGKGIPSRISLVSRASFAAPTKSIQPASIQASMLQSKCLGLHLLVDISACSCRLLVCCGLNTSRSELKCRTP